MEHRLSKTITTQELAKLTAGGDDYIRTKLNVVKGLALRMDLNPDAPDAVVFGKGPRVEGRARLFLESGAVVPAYVKRGVNKWEYLGLFRTTEIRYDKETIEYHLGNRKPEEVAGVLFLASVEEPKIAMIGGGFPDAATRKEIEDAAIKHVTNSLKKDGFQVDDRQNENLGYDLLAIKDTVTRFIEVKGTDNPEPRFFITRNESKFADENSEWFIYIVCMARRSPQLHVFTGREMRQKFSFSPLAWECNLAE